MITSTIQVHYNTNRNSDRPSTQVLTSGTHWFGSLRFGPQVSILVETPDDLELIARAAADLADDLRKAQEATA